MKEDHTLQMLHKASFMIEFWKLVPESKYPKLKKAACCLFLIFGTKYFCESFYSTMKIMKLKYHSQLSNQHFTEFLQIALTNFPPNLKKILIKDCR